MENTPTPKGRRNPAISAAIIGAIAMILAALITALMPKLWPTQPATNVEVQKRVGAGGNIDNSSSTINGLGQKTAPGTEFIRADILLLIYSSTLPGAAGGLALFFFGLRNGHYQDGGYTKKMIIEVVGAMLVASFLIGLLLPQNIVKPVSAFIIGVVWTTILQTIRSAVSGTVEAILGKISRIGSN